jgi:SP family facilitated glucose transporter-like MFS transporter 1
MIDLFRTPTVRWALFITVFLQLSQQFSGITAVFYYSTIILQAAGYDQQAAEYGNLGFGGALIIITIISIFLMDRVGRRLLHLIGLGGMLVASLILVISLLVPSTKFWNIISLIMTILFVTFFGIGPGSIPWLITAELFNQAYRVPASSIAVLVNWSGNVVVGLAFKPLFTVNKTNKKKTFVCILQFFFRVLWINIHFLYLLDFY